MEMFYVFYVFVILVVLTLSHIAMKKWTTYRIVKDVDELIFQRDKAWKTFREREKSEIFKKIN